MRIIELREIVLKGEYSCGRCRTRFEVERDDTPKGFSHKHFSVGTWPTSGPEMGSPYVECPSCRDRIFVNYDSVKVEGKE